MIKTEPLVRDQLASRNPYWCKARPEDADFPGPSMLCCSTSDKLWPKLEQAKTMRICLATTEEQIAKPHSDALQIEHYDEDEDGDGPSWSFVTVFTDEEHEEVQELTSSAMDWVQDNYHRDDTLWVWVEIDG